MKLVFSIGKWMDVQIKRGNVTMREQVSQEEKNKKERPSRQIEREAKEYLHLLRNRYVKEEQSQSQSDQLQC